MNNLNRIIIFALFHMCACQEYIVEIDQGRLSGAAGYDRYGGIYYSFLSIPYAKPPVGELRFKEPQPADSWSGILDATVDLPQCSQFGVDNEDCLYLNVHTPQAPSDSYDDLMDVLVFIHGGGFNAGDGRKSSVGPEFLMPENVVLVSINYRLGIFGSFNLDDASLGYPGNLLMKDQVLALKWVQSNIAKFGGNPDSVTISGQSAGGASVHYLILSPLATGLFHKAIIQSATAISPFSIGLPNNGIFLAEVLDITTTNATEMLNELHSRSVSEINEAQRTVGSMVFSNSWGSIAFPIVEQEMEGQSVFLPDEPLSMIQQGTYNHVPMLIGYTSIDGAVFTLLDPEGIFQFPSDLGIEIWSQEAVDLLNRMHEFYVKSEFFEHPLIQQYTDVYFGYPAYRTAREHKRTTNSSIHFYRFSADTELNFVKPILGFSDVEGALHGDELSYIFNTTYHSSFPIQSGSVEDLAIDRVVKLWTNFAKHADPTPDDSSTNSEWSPLTDDAFNYVDIGSIETVLGVDPDSRSMQFWNEIYSEVF
uniref:Carboxylic ester hydrolase n=1 Tax=Holotrichia parallela TaxID=93412 RepID=A0A088BU35_HOLPA|nr:carboxylesterase [Holotrichia parallela]